MADENKELPYGMIAIIISVFFLVSSMDLIDPSIVSQELSSLLAFVLVGIGAYLIGKNGK